MPEGPDFPIEGSPLLDTQLRGITEALAGAGVVNPGDLAISVGTGDMEIDAAGGTAILDGTEYSFGGASPAHTHTVGDGTYDRWDTVAFDTGTTSVVVHEGTPAQHPTAPDIQAGEVPLAVVSVSQGQTVLGSSDIHNIRAVGEGGEGGASLPLLDDEPTGDTFLVDRQAPSGASQGDSLSHLIGIDGYPWVIYQAEADGSGGTQNELVEYLHPVTINPGLTVNSGIDMSGSLKDTGGDPLIEQTGVPQGKYQGAADNIDSYPLNNSEIANSFISAETDPDTGLGLTSSVGLGGMLTLSRSRGQSYYEPEISASESGTVTAGNQGVVLTHGLADGETLQVYKASLLVTAGGGVDPPPTSLDLIIATVTSSGYTTQSTLISGDGTALTNDETGNPLGSYSNTSGGEQTVAVLVNNQTTSDQDIDASAYGQIA